MFGQRVPAAPSLSQAAWCNASPGAASRIELFSVRLTYCLTVFFRAWLKAWPKIGLGSMCKSVTALENPT